MIKVISLLIYDFSQWKFIPASCHMFMQNASFVFWRCFEARFQNNDDDDELKAYPVFLHWIAVVHNSGCKCKQYWCHRMEISLSVPLFRQFQRTKRAGNWILYTARYTVSDDDGNCLRRSSRNPVFASIAPQKARVKTINCEIRLCIYCVFIKFYNIINMKMAFLPMVRLRTDEWLDGRTKEIHINACRIFLLLSNQTNASR